jgi:hypothetical protein
MKNNKKYFYLYILSCKKEVKIQHSDEKNLKNFLQQQQHQGKNYTLMLLLLYLLLFLLVAVSVEIFH